MAHPPIPNCVSSFALSTPCLPLPSLPAGIGLALMFNRWGMVGYPLAVLLCGLRLQPWPVGALAHELRAS
jgi:hypothetical protein